MSITNDCRRKCKGCNSSFDEPTYYQYCEECRKEIIKSVGRNINRICEDVQDTL